MIPRRRRGQSFEAHQAEVAKWAGYGGDVAALNRDHDPLHRALCRWLGVESYAMRAAAGDQLSAAEHSLARFEEEATLAVQRFAKHAGGKVPT